jgi:peroxiredoxin
MKYLIFLLLISPIIAFASDQVETTLTRIGQQAPNFTVRTIEGGEFELKDLRGRVVLLNFFATWCSPCLNEMPHLELEVWQKYKNDDFLLIALGREHTKRDLVKFTDVVTFTFPIAPDPKREIYSKFATTYIPRNVLIDKSGAIIYQFVGYSEEEFAKMIVQIEKALSE